MRSFCSDNRDQLNHSLLCSEDTSPNYFVLYISPDALSSLQNPKISLEATPLAASGEQRVFASVDETPSSSRPQQGLESCFVSTSILWENKMSTTRLGWHSKTSYRLSLRLNASQRNSRILIPRCGAPLALSLHAKIETKCIT